MPYRAAIFDLDGTLLDTIADLADSCNAALAGAGLPTHPVAPYRYFVGDGVRNLVRQAAGGDCGDEEVDRLVTAMRAEYAQRWAVKSRPYDGVPEMLAGLAERGLVMAVLSNKPDDFTQLCVERFLGDVPFEVIQGVDEKTPPKPDPTGALRVAERLGVSPDEVIYLGDTNTDMKTAKGAGFFAVGVEWGFRPASELQAAGADALIAHPSEVFALLQG